jgi:DMSO/TMAO reductase YedYZ heme-binding membrane subunit
MISLILSILLLIAARYANKFIRKHNTKLYIATIILAAVSYIFIEEPIFTPIKLGGVGFAFFYVVMLIGAFKPKEKPNTNLMQGKMKYSIRMEYSIIGFILITPHAIYQLLEYFNGNVSTPIFGIIAYIIMIPLFITSFQSIRDKMTPESWKKLQKLAYIVYFGLFIHLILSSSMPNLAVYIVLFVLYFVLKFKYEYNKLKQKN